MPAPPEPQPEPRPEPADEDLAAAVDALTEADIPPDDADWAALDDPDSGRPPELAGLSFAEIDDLAAAPPPVPEPGPAGCQPRDGTGLGAGFADGGPLDVLAPGVVLAGCADDAHARLAGVSDDELIGVLRAWWRQTAWAQARALAAIAELARRRPADRTPPAPGPGQFPGKLSEFLADEVAMALTLTQVAAEAQVALAVQFAARPATLAALEAGRVDLRKALVILDAIGPLSEEHAAAVEAAVLPAAEGQTTGELRQAVTKAILALDPDAVRRRREAAQQRARVEAWTDPDGTATLAGRSLPPAEVLAADKRLCQVAAYWKKRIRAAWQRADPYRQQPRPEHGTDLLRARAYLALLLGQPLDAPPADLLPVPEAPPTGNPDGTSPDDGSSAGTHGHESPSADGSPGPGTGAQDGSSAGHDTTSGGKSDTRPASAAGPDDPASPDGELVPGSPELPAGLRRGDPVAALPPMPGADQPDAAAGHPAEPRRRPRRSRRVRAAARRHHPADRLRPGRPPRHPLADPAHRPRRPRPRRRYRPRQPQQEQRQRRGWVERAGHRRADRHRPV